MSKREPQRFVWECKDGILDVRDKQTTASRIFDANRYPEKIQSKIFDAGMKAVFQQRTSSTENADKLAAWGKLDEMFAEGTWERERVGGGFATPAWQEALAEEQNVTVGQLQAFLADNYDKDGRAALKAKVEKKHAARIAEIEKRRAAASIDLEDYSDDE